MRHDDRTIATVLTLASLGMAGVLLAQPQAPNGPVTFTDLDKNSDGVVTEQEMAATHADRMAARAAQGAPVRGAANPPTFADFDRNGDGQLTPSEFAAAQADRRQQSMPPQ
jgi:hypothetical protein